MKKLIILLAVTLISLNCIGQQHYIVYMDSVGTPHIDVNRLPQVGISGQYNNLTNLPSLFVTPTVHSNVTRPINSTTFTVGSTLAWVSYTINVSCTATIGSTAAGKVALQYSTNAGSTWVDVSDVSNSNTVTLAVVLNSVTANDLVLSGVIPGGALVRMVSTITGSTVNSFIRGAETY